MVLVVGGLVLLAACLSVGMLAFITLAVFDADLGLLEFGGGDFTFASHHQPVARGQSVGAFSALRATLSFVLTAGGHLVLRYRARSVLPSDSLFDSIALKVAEPWRVHLMDTPVLGHLL